MDSQFNQSSIPSSNRKLKSNYFIKLGRVVFEENKLFIENHRLVNQAILKFRDWRAEFELEHDCLNATDIPQPFNDLIALLAHESNLSLEALAHHINTILTPFESNLQAYDSFFNVIRQIIKVTAYEERYGLADVVLLLKGSPDAIPTRLSFYRWQAYDTSKFPSEIKQVTSNRREKRKLFSRQLTEAFQKLSANEKINLLYSENSSLKIIYETESPQLFNSFTPEPHVSLAPIIRKPRKRLCSSFDTLFYVGLNDSFDLRQRFLNELPPLSKKKRGLNQEIDLKKAFNTSNTFNSTLYKNIRSLKMKLIQFHEDVRPAYYGTWSKPNTIVNGRRPFIKDENVLDYNYDSEAEWDYDVDGDDIHTLDPYDDDDEEEEEEEDDDIHTIDPNDDEEEMNIDEEEEEVKWVVPEGYLSEEDENALDNKKRSRTRRRIVSRPAKWPVYGNKHFPMKSVILGPSFESVDEPDNHPLSDFKIHMLIEIENKSIGYSPFNQIINSETILDDTTVTETDNTPLTVCFEPNKNKPPLFQREIDKIVASNKEELVNIILENKTKTMMRLVSVLKSNKLFSEYTTAQLQAMIHDIAIQEMRGTNKEYNWYLRANSPITTPPEK